VGFIGTFGEWHGTGALAEALPRVVKERADAHFLLIGDGPLRARMEDALREAGVAQRVTFTGMVAREQAPLCLAACDVLSRPHRAGRFIGSPTGSNYGRAAAS
jgi:glycosyltransferase involved in cell wall biosynthesis